MWTLVGALLIFGERLNGWQWTGVALAIGSIFLFSLGKRKQIHQIAHEGEGNRGYYVCLVLAILIGAGSGLYDKYLMRQYDHNAVQVYYTLYQAAMMLIVWAVMHREDLSSQRWPQIRWTPAIVLISAFLVVSDNVYMLALRDPASMIAVVSTIRRGGAVIGFAYGLIWLREDEVWQKVACMAGICAGLVCLAMGSI
jgi:transporter family protein